jgi:RND family efflux transporter MFP subunit
MTPDRTALRTAAALALTLALAGGCSSSKSPAEAETHADPAPALLAPTDVAVLARTDLTAGIPVSGTLEPAVDVHMASPVAEVLDEVLVHEGQAVRKGQVLARFRVGAAGSTAASAQAALDVAAADVERYRNLYQEGAISKRDVEAAEAQWKAAQAQDSQARTRLGDLVVRAPVDGVIAERMVQGGARVGDGDALFRLVNTAELEFEATVPSEYAARTRVGAPVRLDVTGAGSVAGRVARVNATADPATRQVKVYVRVANPSRTLVGGLFASGTILTAETRNALAAPIAALRGTGASTYVLVVRRGRLEQVPAQGGVRDDLHDRVELTGAVAPGDTVLVAASEGLAAGAPVRVGGER